MSDNDNLPGEGGTGTATPSDSATDNFDPLDFEEQGEPANPDPAATKTGADDEPVEGEARETEEREGDEPQNGDEGDGPSAEDAAKIRLADGTEISVSEARDGYMRQRDYSIKTSQVAEQRKALDAQAQNVSQALDSLAEFLSANLPARPDPALIHSDPQAHYRQQQLYEIALAQVGKILDMGKPAKAASSMVSEQQQREILETENARLAERFPETIKSDGRHKFFERSFAAAREVGFSEKDFANVTDHRLFALAHYAKIGMDALKARQVAQRKVENVPPVTVPRRQNAQGAGVAADAKRSRDAMQRLVTSGSLEDALGVDFD